MMGEVPVGAVVVFQGQIVGRGLNSGETAKSPLGHAEIMAIERASKFGALASLGSYPLRHA